MQERNETASRWLWQIDNAADLSAGALGAKLAQFLGDEAGLAQIRFAGGLADDPAALQAVAGQGDAIARADAALALSRALRAIELAPKPVIARVDGPISGVALALACHGLEMGPEGLLDFTTPGGLFAAHGVSQRLLRHLSVPKALELLQKQGKLTAEAALSHGLAMPEAAAVPMQKPWDIKGFKVPGGAGPLAPFATALFQNGTSRIKAAAPDLPGPRALLAAIYEGALLPFDRALKVEADHYGALLAAPQTAALLAQDLWQAAPGPGLNEAARAALQAAYARAWAELSAAMPGARLALLAEQAGFAVPEGAVRLPEAPVGALAPVSAEARAAVASRLVAALAAVPGVAWGQVVAAGFAPAHLAAPGH